jgi:subtilase family serine protease
MLKGSPLAVAAAALCSFPSILPAQTATLKPLAQQPAAATDTVSFELYLPVQNRAGLETELQSLHDTSSASYHQWLTPQQFSAKYEMSATQISAIEKELAGFGLQTSQISGTRLKVTGTAGAVQQALSTQVQHGTYASGKTVMTAKGGWTLPPVTAQAGAVLVGLSGAVRMRPHSHAVPQNRYSPEGGYWFDDLKQAYSYPSYQALTGKGVTIGILMSGDYNPPDMALYFGHEKLAVPSYKTIQVDGGAPFDPNGSFETHLDLQQSGGMAPKAQVLLYNIPDLSDQSIVDGLSQIIEDNKTDVVSMSFGGPELFYTAAFNDGVDYTSILREEDDLFAKGNALGITFIASSGDSGALDAPPLACLEGATNCGSNVASVEFPSSSPHVTGVGGTNLVTTYRSSNLNSKYLFEEAYADPLEGDIFYGTYSTGVYWGSGGGNSVVFAKPLYQFAVKTGDAKFRTVPDVALHMGGCPGGALTCSTDDSYDLEVIGGELAGVIGTSASAPDFAGLTALNIERQGTRLGNENYYLYILAGLQDAGLPVGVFKTDIAGFNGLYYTTPTGYNRVLGNGTLNGTNFLLAPFVPVAGTPQTPSNP